MLKFPTKIIFAILLSPALTSPLAAMESTKSLTSKVAKSMETAINTIQGKTNQEIEAGANEKMAVEKSLADAELISESASRSQEVTQESLNTGQSEPANKISQLSGLTNIEQFKVCSLGHNNSINNFEFIKQSQITQAATIMKFTAASNPNFKCEIMVLSERNQEVNLKCWHGSKYNEAVSTFKLSYFFNRGYLFTQKNQSQLVLIKPIINNQNNDCPNNFKPVASNKSSGNKTAKEDSEGLAGLTF